MTTQTDAQICALKELLMSRQAFHRSLNEFTRTLPTKVRDDRIVYMVQHLPEIDAREVDEETLKQVMALAYDGAEMRWPDLVPSAEALSVVK